MTAQELFDKVMDQARTFGLVEHKNSSDEGNAVVRKNISADTSRGRYFGIIGSEEAASGAYGDYSFVVFPDSSTDLKQVIVGLVIGSEGFKSDFQLAITPGTRRMFLKLQKPANTFFKFDFADNERAMESLRQAVDENEALSATLDIYDKMIVACEVVDFTADPAPLDTISRWLAVYCEMRNLTGARGIGRRARRQVIDRLKSAEQHISASDVLTQLSLRRFIVLQGAPGTGKTYTALQVSQDKSFKKTFFIQFHAETAYADFVSGIEPDTSSPGQFKVKEGVLCQAIKYAAAHPEENVLLIIDEINRANLSNVLGPVFYLFEPTPGTRTAGVEIGGTTYSCLPANLFVLATMNTADRSLAVVDFALRRRFAWMTLKPRKLTEIDDFDTDLFDAFSRIFEIYATDDELSLQPGQSFFMDVNKRKDTLTYELMPLIKEYLAEGYLSSARNAFCDLFYRQAGLLIYE